jgi:hypothetical protein
MSKGMKIVLLVLAMFLGISILHVWLNIGFDKLGFGGRKQDETTFRVGFLPVT